MVLYLNKLQSPSQKGALCQVWLKFVHWMYRQSFLNFLNTFSVLPNYLLILKGGALQVNKLESPSPKDALICATFGWNLPSGSGFLNFVNICLLFRNYLQIDMGVALHLNNLESLSLMDALCKVCINWPIGSGEDEFQISSMYFCYYIIISPRKRVRPFNWTHLNCIYTMMLCAKFDWNWLSGSAFLF